MVYDDDMHNAAGGGGCGIAIVVGLFPKNGLLHQPKFFFFRGGFDGVPPWFNPILEAIVPAYSKEHDAII